jgi:hypothetical protein
MKIKLEKNENLNELKYIEKSDIHFQKQILQTKETEFELLYCTLCSVTVPFALSEEHNKYINERL